MWLKKPLRNSYRVRHQFLNILVFVRFHAIKIVSESAKTDKFAISESFLKRPSLNYK